MILKTRTGDRDLRDVTLGAIARAAGDPRASGSSVQVTHHAVSGLVAAKEAIRIAAEGVAMLDLGVFRGKDLDRRRVTTTWQARLFDGKTAGAGGSSWWEMLEWIEAALTGRRNAFLLKVKNAANKVERLEFLHPDLVDGKWDPAAGHAVYRWVTDDRMTWSPWVGPDKVLHLRVGHASPGSVFAPTPAEQHRDELKSLLAKARYEGVLYEDGVLQSIAVMLDKDVTPEEAEEFRQMFQAQNGGVDNRAKVRVFGGGASVQTIGLSLADSQYIETMQFGVEAIGRLYGVTASLLGGGSQATRPISPEHESQRWNRYGLEPRLKRIAAAFNADPDLFGPASRDEVAFVGLRSVVDTATESRALVDEVNAGILLVDEARAAKGLSPLPNGAGQIPQITPVGGAPNPNGPADTVDPGDTEDATTTPS